MSKRKLHLSLFTLREQLNLGDKELRDAWCESAGVKGEHFWVPVCGATGNRLRVTALTSTLHAVNGARTASDAAVIRLAGEEGTIDDVTCEACKTVVSNVVALALSWPEKR